MHFKRVCSFENTVLKYFSTADFSCFNPMPNTKKEKKKKSIQYFQDNCFHMNHDKCTMELTMKSLLITDKIVKGPEVVCGKESDLRQRV